MRHTFLFEEGVWRAEGTYIDGTNTALRAEGTIAITHTGEAWINEGSLRLLRAHPVEFQNRYEIVPFEEGKDYTTWKSQNPVIGTLIGKIVVIDDSLISVYESEDRLYAGSEYLLQVSETVYRNRGFAFKEDERISSWAVQLTKIA
ncbi:MAG: hypothetical protein H6Q55_3019 [Deltaproteobacteria bacterium]|nr:hypothetical protein [Deltaproteobacteria bacterium]